MKNIKNIVYISLFASIWGVIEVFLGGYLQLFNLPFRGALMAGFACILLNISKIFVDLRGSVIYISLITAFLKLISFGSFKLGPIAGILIEGFIVEFIYIIFGSNNLSVFLASLFACLEGIPHFFITSWIIYGGSIFEAYLKTIEKVALIFKIKKDLYLWILFIWILGHVFIGLISGYISKILRERLKSEIL
jgi:hypothetical protein